MVHVEMGEEHRVGLRVEGGELAYHVVAEVAPEPVTRPLHFDLDRLSLHVVWHPRLSQDPRHRWLREQLMALLA